MAGLTPKQEAFCLAYLETGNASEAYRRCYNAANMKPAAVTVKASALLANGKVKGRVTELRLPAVTAAQATVTELVGQLTDIIRADPRELIEHRRCNCRHCWGREHAYQWASPVEWERAAAKALDARKPLPTEQGGYGFDVERAPNAECPECLGRGLEHIHIHDTRRLSRQAAALYAGVKQTNRGIEVLMHDKYGAIDRLAKILGFLAPEKREVTGNLALAVELSGEALREELARRGLPTEFLDE